MSYLNSLKINCELSVDISFKTNSIRLRHLSTYFCRILPTSMHLNRMSEIELCNLFMEFDRGYYINDSFLYSQQRFNKNNVLISIPL